MDAIHLVDEGAYLVELGWGGTYEIDGIEVGSNKTVVVESLDKIIAVSTRHGEIVSYTDGEGNEITAADHALQRGNLLGRAFREAGEWTFPDLDAEFEYKKFMARWKTPKRAPDVVERSPVEAKIAEVRTNSGDPDIVSLWNAPSTHDQRKLYRVNIGNVMVATFHDLCQKHGLKGDNEQNRDYLEFAKIEGSYAFSGSGFKDRENRPFTGTLAQCKAAKEDAINRVQAVVVVHAAKKNNVGIPNAGDVVLKLKSVRTNLMGVRAKSGTEASLRGACTAVDDLISAITKAVK